MALELQARLSNRPVQVYLDSADYSRLSDPRSDQAVRDRSISVLTRGVEAGLIEIRFSAAIVSGVAPQELNSMQLGCMRLEMVERLCGQKCLRFMSDIIRQELTQNAPSFSAVSDAAWMPQLDISKQFLTLRRQLRDTISEQPRQVRRSILDKSGRFFKNAKTYFSDGAAASLLEKFPVADEALPTVADFLEGRATASEASRRLVAGVSDLKKLQKLFNGNFEKAASLMAWVRGAGSDHVDRVSKLRELKEKFGNAVDFAQIAKAIEQGRDERLSSLASEEKLDWIGSFLEPEDKLVPFVDAKSIAGRAPTLFAMMHSTAEVLKGALIGKFPKRAKNSDVGDIYNSVYIPHVDLFRCDHAMESALAPIAERFGTRLCSDLDQLVDAVDRRLVG